MAQKMQPCCARLVGKVTATKGELKVLANKTARASEKGRPIEHLLALIETCKAAIKQAEENVHEHEAQHAGEAA